MKSGLINIFIEAQSIFWLVTAILDIPDVPSCSVFSAVECWFQQMCGPEVLMYNKCRWLSTMTFQTIVNCTFTGMNTAISLFCSSLLAIGWVWRGCVLGGHCVMDQIIATKGAVLWNDTMWFVVLRGLCHMIIFKLPKLWLSIIKGWSLKHLKIYTF